MENILEGSTDIAIHALSDLFQDRIDLAQAKLEEKQQPKVDLERCFVGWDAYTKVLATDIDIVLLCTPPVFRPVMLEAAVEAGKHVFMEKPAAIDSPGIRRILAAGEKAKAKNLSIVAGTQRRFEKHYQEAIQRIQDGAIGEIMAARAHWLGGPIGFNYKKNEWTDVEYQMRSWYHFLWLSGDHIVEQHVHNLDVVNWIVGAHPVTAIGVGGRAWQTMGNIWDHHAVLFEYENGMLLTSLCRQIANCHSMVSEFVKGVKGTSDCNSSIRDSKGKAIWEYEGDRRNGYVPEQTALVESVRKGEPINMAQSVAESTMTAIMGRMATYSGQLVKWDDALKSEENLGLHVNYSDYQFGPVDLAPVAVPGGKPYSGEGWVPG